MKSPAKSLPYSGIETRKYRSEVSSALAPQTILRNSDLTINIDQRRITTPTLRKAFASFGPTLLHHHESAVSLSRRDGLDYSLTLSAVALPANLY